MLRLRLGIRTRDILALSLLTLAIVAVTTAIHLVEVTRFTLEQVEREAKLLGEQVLAVGRDTVASNGGPATASLGRSEQLQTLLDAHVGFSRYAVYVAITDGGDEPIVASGGTEAVRPERRPPPLERLTGAGWWVRLRSLLGGETPIYEVRIPLELDGEPFGTIHVGSATGLIEEQLQAALGRALWISLGALLVSWMVALGIAQLTLRPIRLIRRRIGRMRKGEADPDEELEIGGDFEDLASELRLFGQEVRSERLQLLAYKASLEQLARHLQDGVLVLNTEREILFANEACAPMLGVSIEEAFGRRLDEILPDHDLTRSVERAAAEDGDTFDLSLVCRNGERSEKHFLASIYPVDDPDGAEAGFVILAEDLETLRVLRTLVRYGAQMTAVKRLAGGLVHEIKNPLNAMNLHVELLRQRLAGDRNGPKVQKSLSVISREIARLDRLVREFQRLASPEELELAPLDLRRLVESLVDLVAPEAEQQAVRLHLEVAEEDVEIYGDEERLTQAFLNIVRNALQAMPEGGELSIRATTGSDLLTEIEFADSGPGIEPDELEKIFQLYYTTKETGSGMGLFLVHRIVQQHGGLVTAASEPGRGTRILVRLPRGEMLTAVEAAGERPERPRGKAR